MGLLELGGLGAVAAKPGKFRRSKVMGEITAVTQYFEPLFSGAYQAIQEGDRQEQAAKQQAKAVEGQSRLDAEQARRAALYANGQDYLYFVRSGVYSGVGAPLDLLTQNALEREKEAMSIELKGWNEGKRLRIEGKNAAKAGVLSAIQANVNSIKTLLGQFGLGQSPFAGTGASGASKAYTGYAAAEGGVSYAGATAAGIDAAAGGAAATGGAGSSLLSAAVIV